MKNTSAKNFQRRLSTHSKRQNENRLIIRLREIQNVNRSTVTRWKQADRLVFDDNGLVNFKASDKRIKATEDPNRDDVRRRHAINRGDMPAADIDLEIGESDLSDNVTSYQESAQKRTLFGADGKIDYEKASAN